MAVEEFSVILTTNAEEMIQHLNILAEKPVDAFPLKGVSFVCNGPKCYKVQGVFPLLHMEVAEDSGEMYSEMLCRRCGAVYLITWGKTGSTTLVERRGWRDIDTDGFYGRLQGHRKEQDVKKTGGY